MSNVDQDKDIKYFTKESKRIQPTKAVNENQEFLRTDRLKTTNATLENMEVAKGIYIELDEIIKPCDHHDAESIRFPDTYRQVKKAKANKSFEIIESMKFKANAGVEINPGYEKLSPLTRQSSQKSVKSKYYTSKTISEGYKDISQKNVPPIPVSAEISPKRSKKSTDKETKLPDPKLMDSKTIDAKRKELKRKEKKERRMFCVKISFVIIGTVSVAVTIALVFWITVFKNN